MEYINRPDYLRFLNSHKNKNIIKVVSGVRRCGKSTLFEIFQQQLLTEGVSKSQIIAINFESVEYGTKNYQEVYYEIKSKLIAGKTTYIFLDEIQNLHSFEKMVDGLFVLPNVDIYLTGSNAYFMSGELATLLSGRYVELKMLPLSFKEYSTAFADKSLISIYNTYITFSSFPYVLKYLDDFEATQHYLNSLYGTILIKDIIQRYRITDVKLLERIISFLFSNIGSRLSSNNIANILTSDNISTNYKTVEKYIKALQDSLIIYEAKRYNLKGKELLKTLSKYYVVDLGLRRLICGLSSQDEGHILENVIYLELLRRGYKVAIGQSDNSEIDFIASSINETLFIQVALTVRTEEVYKREITPLLNLNNNYPKIILTLDEAPVRDDNGIKIIYALDWLIN